MQALENFDLAENDMIIAQMETISKQPELYQNVDYYRLEEYMDLIGQALIILVVLSFVVITISQIYIMLSL